MGIALHFMLLGYVLFLLPDRINRIYTIFFQLPGEAEKDQPAAGKGENGCFAQIPVPQDGKWQKYPDNPVNPV
jgi:hypothetical protein